MKNKVFMGTIAKVDGRISQFCENEKNWKKKPEKAMINMDKCIWAREEGDKEKL